MQCVQKIGIYDFMKTFCRVISSNIFFQMNLVVLCWKQSSFLPVYVFFFMQVEYALHKNGLGTEMYLILYNILTSQHIIVVIYLII